jgi:hypothetical protein
MRMAMAMIKGSPEKSLVRKLSGDDQPMMGSSLG